MPAKAKGILFGHLQDFAERTRGKAAYETAAAKLSAADREILSGFVLALGWYPVGTWNRLLEAYLHTNFENPRRGMDEFAAYLGERELRGVVKFAIKLGSPEFMLNRTSFLWSRYFDSGEFSAHEVGPRNYQLFLSAPLGEEDAPSRYNCAQGVGAWLTRGLALAGSSEGKVEERRCRFDGAPRCEFVATW